MHLLNCLAFPRPTSSNKCDIIMPTNFHLTKLNKKSADIVIGQLFLHQQGTSADKAALIKNFSMIVQICQANLSGRLEIF